MRAKAQGKDDLTVETRRRNKAVIVPADVENQNHPPAADYQDRMSGSRNRKLNVGVRWILEAILAELIQFRESWICDAVIASKRGLSRLIILRPWPLLGMQNLERESPPRRMPSKIDPPFHHHSAAVTGCGFFVSSGMA